MQEAPHYTFNVNVFKSNVQLAISAAELKQNEDEVKDLANFLKEKAVTSAVNDLKSLDNIPSDSLSLETFLHARGVNIRYLGTILNQLTKPIEVSTKSPASFAHLGKYKHIRALLEREIYLRSIKHVFNRILREESGETDLMLSNVVCHILNCILAPSPMISALDEDKIKFSDVSVQSKFQFFPDETRPEPRKRTGSTSSP